MLNVVIYPFMLNVIMLSVVMLNVVAPQTHPIANHYITAVVSFSRQALSNLPTF